MSAPLLRSFIDGHWRDGSRRLEDRNPSRPSELVAEIAAADGKLAAEAVGAASRSFDSWRRLPAPDRGRLLRAAADLLDDRAPAIGHDLATEEGKTLPEAVAETHGAASQLRYAAGQAEQDAGHLYHSHSSNTRLLLTRREPIGVVVCITPWNFPISLPAAKLGHALVAGNSVVWKPSEVTPLTSRNLLLALLDAGIPENAIQMVIGTGSEVGPTLLDCPEVRAVSFTGSNPVGATLRQQLANRNVRLQLELGGKNAAVVFPDADLDLAAEQITLGAFESTGQKCTSTSRVIACNEIFDDLTSRIVALTKDFTVGDPFDPATRMGPLASSGQYDKMMKYIDMANQTSSALVGGTPVGFAEGYFVSPSVYVGVDPAHPLAQEEIFGPLLVIMPAGSGKEAIKLANATDYGLVTSIFTSNLSYALECVDELEHGVVKVNQSTTGNEPQVPFGGFKVSSSGSREMGQPASEFYSQWKTVYVRTVANPGASTLQDLAPVPP